jgi:hypothetical protein
MPTTTASCVVEAPPDEVWRLLLALDDVDRPTTFQTATTVTAGGRR